MKAIDKAWKENLELDEEDRFKSKEEIIENECACNCCFKMPLNQPKYCTDGDDDEICTRCWNREIEGNEQESNSIFEKLEHSPIEFCIKTSTEEYLIENLRDNESILYMRQDEELKYEQIPIIIKWLQDVYDYCTELKNRVEYVDFMTAKQHMYKGNLARYENYDYYINNGELLRSDDNKGCALSLKAIESDKWILL